MQSWITITLSSYLSVSKLSLPEEALERAKEKNFEVTGYQFVAASEHFRKPRIVRVGAVQNQIVKPTFAPIPDQV